MPSTTIRHMPRKLSRPAAGALAVLLLVALPASGDEIYTWKDANGVTHYSDAPPPKGDFTSRQIRQRATSVDAGEAEAEEPPPDTACSDARRNLELLHGDQVIGPDADGDGKPDSTFSPEQRVAQITLAEAAIEVHCAGSPDADADAGEDADPVSTVEA